MRIRLKHNSFYTFEEPADLGPHIIRLRPVAHTRALVHTYNLELKPDCEVRWQHDPWGNHIARLTFPTDQKFRELRITVDAAFDIRPINPFDFYVDDRCERVPFTYPDGLAGELAPFLSPVAPLGPRTATLIEAIPFEGFTIEYLIRVNRLVAERVQYIIRNEPGIQTSEETLLLGSGSCRDSAWLLCEVLRARGIATRFASGYLVQLTDEGNIPDEAKGVESDVLDLHAWAEAYIPGAGWIGLDGTSGLFCGEGHIPLACTVKPELAAPVTGTASAGTKKFSVEMTVQRLGHEPRPRKPYDEDEWQQITAAGDAVDHILKEKGLNLTSGGEPTWTSRLFPHAAEWMTEALGPTKWTQGLKFCEELSRRFGEGTLTMHRFGKQYPGESLPRWAFHLMWRKDGIPIWRDGSLLAKGDCLEQAKDAAGEYDDTERLGKEIASRLGVAPNLIAGYEDPWRFIREEQDLPLDINPLEAKLDDPEERRRLARTLGNGLGRPVGYSLPIQYWNARWLTAAWTFKRGQMFLLPGDSPMGLRLPLDRLPGCPPKVFPVDASSVSDPIPFDPRTRRMHKQGSDPNYQQETAEQVLGSGSVLRTALCLESRKGITHVFLPPLPSAEAFLELIATIEDSARALNQPIRIEGYPPPPDPRIQSCLITPDPGVIEVNLPVAASFREYLNLMETLGETAIHAGLRTEKYQLDGREIGSGGGNHLTLGGPTPVESPFLVRPDLLSSLIRCLQNHPSLSYLFTGLFVGPTSQAPRIDEARHDSLEELELALLQVPRAGEQVFPWLIDRLLRNILIDVSGNTHRTEVCIDKLYAPEHTAGRLGIVELRAFEMPPNERMAAVQMLLVRALIARFAIAPYEHPLVPWGSQLHDRFMLPFFLEQDIKDVAYDLRRFGIPMESEWFRPFIDYRFPVCGTLRLEGIEVELRTALEPWPTLGEQPAGPVVARYVDSSLERLQIRATGLIQGRHKIAVNGFELPMHATGINGETVAGLRFRAWQPPNCLHPNIRVHHPVRFDVVDTWGQRSMGACTYHVWHPEGRAFADPPLTAFEAAARRAQRFTTEGHAPWPVKIKPAVVRPNQPLTLDLRWTGLLHHDVP